jgi:hypothetical protein
MPYGIQRSINEEVDMARGKDYQAWLSERLQDRDEAVAYLNSALEESLKGDEESRHLFLTEKSCSKIGEIFTMLLSVHQQGACNGRLGREIRGTPQASEQSLGNC